MYLLCIQSLCQLYNRSSRVITGIQTNHSTTRLLSATNTSAKSNRNNERFFGAICASSGNISQWLNTSMLIFSGLDYHILPPTTAVNILLLVTLKKRNVLSSPVECTTS